MRSKFTENWRWRLATWINPPRPLPPKPTYEFTRESHDACGVHTEQVVCERVSPKLVIPHATHNGWERREFKLTKAIYQAVKQ